MALLFINQHSFAQERVNDTTYNKGHIVIENPKSIVKAYTYDPATDR